MTLNKTKGPGKPTTPSKPTDAQKPTGTGRVGGPTGPMKPSSLRPTWDKAVKVNDPYSRVSYRKGFRENVWNSRIEPSTSQVRDPLTGKFMSLRNKWDMGHITGHEHRNLQRRAAMDGLSRQEWINQMHNIKLYHPELQPSNRCHKLEAGDLHKVYFPSIESQLGNKK